MLCISGLRRLQERCCAVQVHGGNVKEFTFPGDFIALRNKIHQKKTLHKLRVVEYILLEITYIMYNGGLW